MSSHGTLMHRSLWITIQENSLLRHWKRKHHTGNRFSWYCRNCFWPSGSWCPLGFHIDVRISEKVIIQPKKKQNNNIYFVLKVPTWAVIPLVLLTIAYWAVRLTAVVSKYHQWTRLLQIEHFATTKRNNWETELISLKKTIKLQKVVTCTEVKTNKWRVICLVKVTITALPNPKISWTRRRITSVWLEVPTSVSTKLAVLCVVQTCGLV
jgi:hypothetical protein